MAASEELTRDGFGRRPLLVRLLERLAYASGSGSSRLRSERGSRAGQCVVRFAVQDRRRGSPSAAVGLAADARRSTSPRRSRRRRRARYGQRTSTMARRSVIQSRRRMSGRVSAMPRALYCAFALPKTSRTSRARADRQRHVVAEHQRRRRPHRRRRLARRPTSPRARAARAAPGPPRCRGRSASPLGGGARSPCVHGCRRPLNVRRGSGAASPACATIAACGVAQRR